MGFLQRLKPNAGRAGDRMAKEPTPNRCCPLLMARLLLAGRQTNSNERKQRPDCLERVQRFPEHDGGNEDCGHRLQIDVQHRLLRTQAVDRLPPQGHGHDHAHRCPVE